jgi:hypothetical protein
MIYGFVTKFVVKFHLIHELWHCLTCRDERAFKVAIIATKFARKLLPPIPKGETHGTVTEMCIKDTCHWCNVVTFVFSTTCTTSRCVFHMFTY